jgi:hypothetical protein
MLRILSLAATAAALVAAPAMAAESIHVSIAGKTPAQVKADVRQAAAELCHQQTFGSLVEADAQRACIEHTVRHTLAQATGRTLAQR